MNVFCGSKGSSRSLDISGMMRVFDVFGVKACSRKNHAKGCHVSIPKVNTSKVNLPVIFLYDTFADPEPEPCAFLRLGGKERLEEMLGVLRSDSRSRIAY